MTYKKGFTLIEIMIVVAIIGVIASIAVPAIKGEHDKSNKEPCSCNKTK